MKSQKYSRLLLSPDDAERAWDSLYRCGALGGWERDEPPPTVFIAAFPDVEAARAARDLLAGEGIAAVIEEDVEAPDPFAAHRATLTTFSIDSFRIDPRGEPDGGSEGPGTIWIPAHGAFGTGLHASTRGILAWMGGRDLAGKRTLDVGCGSGILAIAALRRRASFAVAFDVDADAVFEARRNLFRNGGAPVALFAGEIAALRGAFDLVLANLIWEESGPMVESIGRLLAPAGTVIFSGILDERESAASAGIRQSGLSIVSIERDEEWRTIVAVKASASSSL